jgi:precorrin-8X/cobalt-precorrin-8 methylmutase
MPFDYIKDPAEIYRKSFEIIASEVELDRLPKPMAHVAARIIHACGMVDIMKDFAFTPGAAMSGVEALKSGAPVYCDVEMVRTGIIRRNLPDNVELVCTLNDPRIGDIEEQNTRSANAVDLWDKLQGSICVIGNAPTALYRLLERMEEGAGVPALVIAMPVGFVGAAESKDELTRNKLGCHVISVLGRRGGSAMASAAVNALAILAGMAE